MFYHTTAFYVLGCQPIGEYCSIALNCRLDGIGTSALQRHSSYVDNLRLWFMEVGADKITDNRTLKELSTLFKDAAIKGNQTYNELSSLFGAMQEPLHDKARKKAVEKLSQLVQFHIK